MKAVRPHLLRLLKSLKHKSDYHMSTREAIAFSVVMHVLAFSAFASFWAADVLHKLPKQEESLVFEITPALETLTKAAPAASRESATRNEKAEKQSGRASNGSHGNMKREAYLKSALASLDKLTEPFSMKLHAVSSDSVGGFSPLMDGKVPDSIYDSFGRKKGEGLGNGEGAKVYISGGGSCPGGGGPTIFQ